GGLSMRRASLVGFFALLACAKTTTTKAVPGAPGSVSAARGDASATVTWTAPQSDGGSPILSYEVTAAPGGATASTTGALMASVTGLTNGTAYTFTVRATNAVGQGSASSPSSAVTPAAVPGAPAGVSATAGVRSA